MPAARTRPRRGVATPRSKIVPRSQRADSSRPAAPTALAAAAASIGGRRRCRRAAAASAAAASAAAAAVCMRCRPPRRRRRKQRQPNRPVRLRHEGEILAVAADDRASVGVWSAGTVLDPGGGSGRWPCVRKRVKATPTLRSALGASTADASCSLGSRSEAVAALIEAPRPPRRRRGGPPLPAAARGAARGVDDLKADVLALAVAVEEEDEMVAAAAFDVCAGPRRRSTAF